jgi:hypothetical protein
MQIEQTLPFSSEQEASNKPDFLKDVLAKLPPQTVITAFESKPKYFQLVENFLLEKGNATLLELLPYKNFIAELIESRGQDKIFHVSLIDKELKLKNWFLEKIKDAKLKDLLPFQEVFLASISLYPLEIFTPVKEKFKQEGSLEQLNDWVPFLKALQVELTLSMNVEPINTALDELDKLLSDHVALFTEEDLAQYPEIIDLVTTLLKNLQMRAFNAFMKTDETRDYGNFKHPKTHIEKIILSKVDVTDEDAVKAWFPLVKNCIVLDDKGYEVPLIQKMMRNMPATFDLEKDKAFLLSIVTETDYLLFDTIKKIFQAFIAGLGNKNIFDYPEFQPFYRRLARMGSSSKETNFKLLITERILQDLHSCDETILIEWKDTFIDLFDSSRSDQYASDEDTAKAHYQLVRWFLSLSPLDLLENEQLKHTTIDILTKISNQGSFEVLEQISNLLIEEGENAQVVQDLQPVLINLLSVEIFYKKDDD